jgi:hypothetical protein
MQGKKRLEPVKRSRPKLKRVYTKMIQDDRLKKKNKLSDAEF